MNSATAIEVDGHARVQVGNSYTTIHNHSDSNRHPADPLLAASNKSKLRAQFLKRLYTSPYEERKNRNPQRAAGTCEWKTSAPLWVSADPGCGKSVLSRYLVDDVFPSSAVRTTCYFFFKDDFDDQRLFTQKPSLLSDDILEDFEEVGDQLFVSFPKLWSVLVGATNALDECVNSTRLANALTQHYSKSKGISTLKFLATSRPYLRIQRDFQNLQDSQPTIHLSGESQEEVDKIAQEIFVSIQQRIEELGRTLRLDIETKKIMYDELTAFDNRSYLWVKLIFHIIDEAVFLTKSDLRDIIRNLPRTVEEAYEDILHKSRDPDKARVILHIIVAADRPLRLPEMAVALALQAKSYRRYKGLQNDLISSDSLYTAIRETCGLFVVVKDSQIFLLHQTAREFLVRLPHESPGVHTASSSWLHSFDLNRSHRLLSEICIHYLLLAEFQSSVREKGAPGLDDQCDFAFLDYAASNWADHYREVGDTGSTELQGLALQLCDVNSPACIHWLKIYGEKRVQDSEFCQELPTSLLIASYFGLNSLIRIILHDKKTRLDAISGSSRRTALSWASEKGHYFIVQKLLDRIPKHKVIWKDKLSSSSPTIINKGDKLGRSPLWDRRGQTPLLKSAADGNEVVLRLLLDCGAKVDAQDDDGGTALILASKNGYDGIVEQLLDRGAKVDAQNNDGWTALITASEYGHDSVVKQLLDRGAKVDAQNNDGWTALILASKTGHDGTIKQLLDRGAKVDAQDKYG
ncbi:ankyrin repeat-containing domain protein [Xylariaceae sp. FL1651]|nr:ankyrin repeat-containing domain protein [Xylariaceae sp. FL1651]